MNRNFSPEQRAIIAQMHQHFGVDPNNVSLDESGDLFFALDDLNLLTIKLAPDIQALTVSAHTYENELNIVSAHASVSLIDGRFRGVVKSAQVGEDILGSKIETLIQAANIADGRAARACLRAIGFDPIREFQAFLHTQENVREFEPLTQLEKDRRYIHKVRDDLDMADEVYRQHLMTVTLGTKDTTEAMTESQLSMCAVFFRGLATANEMSRRKAA